MMNKFLVVGGVVVVVLIVALVLLFKGGNDVDTTLDLNVVGGVCTIVTNAADKDVTVGKNHKVTWTVRNACPADQLVTVGNFRAAPTGSNSDCSAPTEGGGAYPFKAGEEANRSVNAPANTTNRKIEQKEAKDPGTSPATYYFDVCLGTAKKDPKLVIEP